MTRTRARLGAALAVALTATLLVPAGATAAPSSIIEADLMIEADSMVEAEIDQQGVAPAASLNNSSCRSALPALRLFPADRSRIDSGVITLADWTVNFRAVNWQVDHPQVELLTRAFHSAAWMIPERRDDMPEAIALFAEQARANPDPGATMTARQLRERGWVEGHTTWRLKTALCLYRVATPEQRDDLLPAIDQLIAANLDPRRYYGPPRNPAHNHGLMADRELLNAARYLQRPELAALAVDRLELQKDQMYDSCGLNFEQASSYQFLHASLWQQLLRRIDDPRFAGRIAKTVDTITNAAHGLAFPDGTVPAIGDGVTRRVDDLSMVRNPLRMLCPETGWSSRRAANGGVTQQLITRFGPATRFHGHSDKGSFVWWVGHGSEGVSVVADRGTPPKTRRAQLAQARSAQSHSIFDWRGVSDQQTTATTTRNRGRETVTITTPRRDWTRNITFTPGRMTLRVSDQVSAVNAGSARSFLPLDPQWRRTANPREFRTQSGWQLRVTCTDSSGSDLPVRTARVSDFQQVPARPALRLTCAVPDAQQGIHATLQVRSPRTTN